MPKIGLYLAGGGARGAYQAGVLKGIHTLLGVKNLPFQVITGVSVGSINAAVLVEHALSFSRGTEKLLSFWSDITCNHVFDASNLALSKSFLRNISNILTQQGKTGFLLDTSPLEAFILKIINFDILNHNIKQGYVETMEVISNCYESHQTTSFYQHFAPTFPDWHYPKHASQRVSLNKQHIMASSSLPLFFPPVNIDGFHYGDGGMGLATPLRGAIRCQVDKILVIGTRHLPTVYPIASERQNNIGLATILGGMLNGLFLDNLERDVETVNRMNEIAGLLSIWKKKHSPWRPIKTLYLTPSRDIAILAQAHYSAMPSLLRTLLNFLGAKSHSGDLLSFLLFEQAFTEELMALGIEDTMANREHILTFFNP